MSKQIQLSQGKYAIVDDEDFEYLNSLGKWSTANMYNLSYAIKKHDGRNTLMHRLIIGAKKGEIVDHINGDGLDNRKCNLRICLHKENLRNRSAQKNSKSGVKGVCKPKGRNKWRVQIKINGKIKNIGNFYELNDAIKCYNSAATKHYGEFAKLNEIPQ